MNIQTYGPWINVNPAEIVKSKALSADQEGVESSPSPYDVPMAVRIDEGDLADPAYAVELRYLGGDERTRRNRVADLVVETGAKSGRVYRVIVEAKESGHRARAGVEQIAKALESAKVNPSHLLHLVNVFMVGKAIEAHADDLARQLTKFPPKQALHDQLAVATSDGLNKH